MLTKRFKSYFSSYHSYGFSHFVSPNLITGTFYVKNGKHQYIVQYLLCSILADGFESCALPDRGCNHFMCTIDHFPFYYIDSFAALELLSNLCYLCMHASEINFVK